MIDLSSHYLLFCITYHCKRTFKSTSHLFVLCFLFRLFALFFVSRNRRTRDFLLLAAMATSCFLCWTTLLFCSLLLTGYARASSAGDAKEKGLSQTPTWAVALVCTFFILVSVLLEKALHRVATVCPEFPLFFLPSLLHLVTISFLSGCGRNIRTLCLKP